MLKTTTLLPLTAKAGGTSALNYVLRARPSKLCETEKVSASTSAKRLLDDWGRGRSKSEVERDAHPWPVPHHPGGRAASPSCPLFLPRDEPLFAKELYLYRNAQ